MGKGDKKSRRGKITMGSYGVKRPRKKNKPAVVATKKVVAKKVATPKAEAAPKKVAVKKAAPKKAAKKAE